MIKSSITFKRPNTSVPWHNSPELDIVPKEFMEYIMTYMYSGKLLHAKSTESSNGLQYTLIGYWVDQESLDKFNQDPFGNEIYNKRDNYYKTIGGEVEPLVVTEVDAIDPNDL